MINIIVVIILSPIKAFVKRGDFPMLTVELPRSTLGTPQARYRSSPQHSAPASTEWWRTRLEAAPGAVDRMTIWWFYHKWSRIWRFPCNFGTEFGDFHATLEQNLGMSMQLWNRIWGFPCNFWNYGILPYYGSWDIRYTIDDCGGESSKWGFP